MKIIKTLIVSLIGALLMMVSVTGCSSDTTSSVTSKFSSDVSTAESDIVSSIGDIQSGAESMTK